MKISVLLADKGTQNPQAGTLNLLNVGWSHTALRATPMPTAAGLPQQIQLLTPPHAVAVFFEAEHQYCNHPVELTISLVDEDDHIISMPGPAGSQPVHIVQNIVIASPPQAPIGSPGRGNILIEIVPGLSIPPGTYNWKVTLAGQEDADWRARFYVLPAQQQPSMTFLQPPPAQS